MKNLLYIIIGVLFVFWLLGFIFRYGGMLIHLILIVCGILFIIQWITGKRMV